MPGRPTGYYSSSLMVLTGHSRLYGFSRTEEGEADRQSRLLILVNERPLALLNLMQNARKVSESLLLGKVANDKRCDVQVSNSIGVYKRPRLFRTNKYQISELVLNSNRKLGRADAFLHPQKSCQS